MLHIYFTGHPLFRRPTFITIEEFTTIENPQKVLTVFMHR